jgi:hypothetical protein
MTEKRDYRVGAPQTDRVKLCTTKAVEGPIKKEEIWVENKKLVLDVYRISLDVPRYRLANKRTKNLMQPSYIRRNDLSKDHFADVENDQAQIDQHKILIEIARGPEGKKVGFEEEMRNPQKEVIVIQGNGEILSGNTRTSIWRELYNQDSDKYSDKKTIEAAFYNTTDPNAEMEFENYEDIKKYVKIPYNWYEEASTFESQINDMGYSMKRVQKMSSRTKKTIETLINSKKYADQFLNRYKDIDPVKLRDAQFAFKGVSEVCSSLENNNLKSDSLMAKRIMMMCTRRAVMKDDNGQVEVKVAGNKYKRFMTLSKTNENNKAVRLNEVVSEIKSWSGDKEVDEKIKSNKLSSIDEKNIVKHALVSMNNHYESDKANSYDESIKASLTSISDAYKNWITNKPNLSSESKTDLKTIARTIQKFSKK